MRTTSFIVCLLLMLVVAGCGGKDKDKKASNADPNKSASIPANTKLVKLELPGMT